MRSASAAEHPAFAKMSLTKLGQRPRLDRHHFPRSPLPDLAPQAAPTLVQAGAQVIVQVMRSACRGRAVERFQVACDYARSKRIEHSQGGRAALHRSNRIAVVGAGLGGLTCAGFLQREGFSVTVFEQAPTFSRIGAGIILSANVMKVLRRLGLERRLLDVGIRPDAFVSRASDTGATLHELTLDAGSEARFGAPYINIHRGDLHGVLETALAPGTIAFDHCLTGLERRGNALELAFANGVRHRGRHRRRRRRHNLQGAREPVRPGAAALHRARRPPCDLPDRAPERLHHARLHEVVGP